MHALDWLVVGAYLVWVVTDGLKRTKGSDEVKGYFLANRSLPWWAVGLSVMATQLSAITLVGTTGQGYRDGMRCHMVKKTVWKWGKKRTKWVQVCRKRHRHNH